MTDIASGIAVALQGDGWYAGPSILSGELTRRLSQRARDVTGEMRSARIGQAVGASPDENVRGDDSLWLSDCPHDASERQTLEEVHRLRAALNEALYLGAHDVEMHFARYRVGRAYQAHRDVFRTDDSRLVSFVVYLNPGWADEAGGELVLYASDDSGEVVTKISPREGTMVCFLSERFPHEVLPATRERYSLSGWLRRFKSPSDALRTTYVASQ